MLVKFCYLMLAVLFSLNVSANNSQEKFQEQIYTCFIDGKMDKWERTIDEMEQYYASYRVPGMLYDLLIARYGFIAVSLDEEEKRKARVQIEKAEVELERLFNYRSYVSNAYALKGALLAFRISLNPFNAIVLGNRANNAIDKAVETDENNPAAWMERGNSAFYTPSAFGGSKQEAVKYYKKAVELFENNLKPNQRWLYLNTLVGLAKSYEHTGEQLLAINTYKRALEYEPEFSWVRDELLPKAKKEK